MLKWRMKKISLFLCAVVLFSMPAWAYVGPGAGFAFAGSFFFIFVAFFLALFNFITFPIRAIIKFFRRRKTLRHAKFRRVIIVGFDGMDYHLMKKFSADGVRFPHFEQLEKQGTFAPLLSTQPPISPVAWSTFATGVNPGKHNIFDFLTTDRNNYMPKIAGSQIIAPKRFVKIGGKRFPLGKARIELLRKSKSFWKIVGEHGIFSSVLRVPFTFPAEKFYGNMLAGLGTPDLRGTQGSYSFYSDEDFRGSDIWDGVAEKLELRGDHTFHGVLKGPDNPFSKKRQPLEKAFSLCLDKENQRGTFKVGNDTFELQKGKISEWIKVDFRAGLIKISGVVQLVLEDLEPVRLYVSPINIDPEKPSMPVSHPKIFSVYLSKLLGSYATLGMAEDTTAVNEKVLSEDAFLQQVYKTQAEREASFFDSLGKVKNGLIVQVFEATDRIQHMFWRYLPDSGSPAEHNSTEPEVTRAIEKVYLAMDDFLGRLFKKMNSRDLLMIVSDHGFNAFNRGFHVNSWLYREGYIVLKDGKKHSDKWFADVDWTRSRAYGQGLNGIFINQAGREKFGTVKAGAEAEALKAEICRKLMEVVDPKTGDRVVKKAWKREELYRGPYTANAPDVVLGYTAGSRVSWESAVNYVGDELFSDNLRMWSGDHAFTRDQVPGIFYSNHSISKTDPALIDISPTVLGALGIKKPVFIEGRDLVVAASDRKKQKG